MAFPATLQPYVVQDEISQPILNIYVVQYRKLGSVAYLTHSVQWDLPEATRVKEGLENNGLHSSGGGTFVEINEARVLTFDTQP